MAARFNTMLDTLEGSRRALDDSVHAQRQLVADASHELRTPVTSLRTNIEVLLAGGELPDDDRRRLLEDVRAETEELSALITDVIELARGDEPLSGVEEVQLDALVEEAVARAQRRRPAVRFEARARADGRRGPARPPRPGDRQPARQRREVLARRGPTSRSRCAAASSPCATTAPASRRTTARTSSIASTAARPRAGGPGSGLGLAIVRQVAETHGGTIAVYEGAGGGSRFVLTLPVLAAAAPGPRRAGARRASRAAR